MHIAYPADPRLSIRRELSPIVPRPVGRRYPQARRAARCVCTNARLLTSVDFNFAENVRSPNGMEIAARSNLRLPELPGSFHSTGRGFPTQEAN